MRLWASKPRKSARALIVRDGQLLVMHRKRFDMKTHQWIEYHSIPGGGIEKGETPQAAVVRELHEEMGVTIKVLNEIAHWTGRDFEHYIYSAALVSDGLNPVLMPDSEEALEWHTEHNQFIPRWIAIDSLTKDNLHYYSDYLELIHQLNDGKSHDAVQYIDGR